MFLYSEAGRVRLGSITPEQIQTTVLEAIVRTNQAMVNSEIDLVVSLVHVGPVSESFSEHPSPRIRKPVKPKGLPVAEFNQLRMAVYPLDNRPGNTSFVF